MSAAKLISSEFLAEIHYFYDIVSPYSYLGFETLMKYKSIWNVQVVLKPMSLGGVMQVTGNVPPATNPIKAKFLGKDLKRSASLCQVNLKVPLSKFPVNTMKVQRILTLISQRYPDELESATRAFWVTYWGNDNDVSEDSVIEATLKSLQNLSSKTDELMNAAENDELAKNQLKSTTEEALKYGAFGAPTIIVRKNSSFNPTNSGSKDPVQPGKSVANGEMFFGNDRFDHIAAYLNVKWFGHSPPTSDINYNSLQKENKKKHAIKP